jgi:hypothetical protein
MVNFIDDSFTKLRNYCVNENFKGYDPYDGLNSTLFGSLPFIRSNHYTRLAWIQLFKRSPFNLRRLAGIRKDYNPKALGLFLSGYCALYKTEKTDEYSDKIQFFTEKIIKTSVPGYSGACWGYNFDWEATVFAQPKDTPTLVVSSFVANALLDAYDTVGNDNYLLLARSTCDFFLCDLNRTYDNDSNFALSYSKLDKSVIYNASMLGARLMARIYSITGEEKLLSESRKLMTYCCNCQKADGSWTYGAFDYQQWIDSFHTGFNLECLSDYMKFSSDYSFSENLAKGYDYYLNTFFTSDGVPKYYSNSVYPIDIHAPAQLVVTASKLGKFTKDKEQIDRVLFWVIKKMQSEKGYFYYQINRLFSSKVPYMRWSQAWMFYALSLYKFEIWKIRNQNIKTEIKK